MKDDTSVNKASSIPKRQSATSLLFKMYGLPTRGVPSKVQGVILCLLHTLNKHEHFSEAMRDIENLLGVDMLVNNTEDIKSRLQIPEMIGLRDNDKALRLAILLYPHVITTDTHLYLKVPMSELSKIFGRSAKNKNYADLKQSLIAINKLDLGYKLIQKQREGGLNDFHIVKYTDRKSLFENLKEGGIMSPSIIDKLI